MTERKGFDLGDYVEVKDRIKTFYELYGNGRLVTGDVVMHTAPDGKQRIQVQAFAYRSPDDPHPGVGHSWMEIPGTTSYTKGSELENTETSAWGRAIGSLGVLIDRSIASANEVQNKQEPLTPASMNAREVEQLRASARPHEDADSSPNDAPNGQKGDREEMMGRVRRRGIIRKGTADDYKLIAKQGPEGHVLGFRLEIDGDKNIPQCAVTGPLGEALFLATAMKPETLIGKAATVAGLLYNVRRPDKPGSWYRLHVDTIETDEWILPAPIDLGPPAPDYAPPADDRDDLPEPPADLPLFGETPAA